MDFYPTIYFVFPYRGVGGVPVLFFRVATYLKQHNLAHPILVDYADGAMSVLARAADSEITVVVYPERGRLVIPGNSFAVFQSMTPWSMFSNLRLHKDTRVLFWTCHPYNLVLPIPGFRFFGYRFKRLSGFMRRTILAAWFTKLKRFIEKIAENRGLVFMDHENRRNTEEQNGIVLENPDYLPIPIGTAEIISRPSLRDEKQRLRITWIGRLVDFKYYPLRRLLISMEQYAQKQMVDFQCTIIGDGPYLRTLRKLANDLSRVDVVFHGDVGLSDLRVLIDYKTDIVAAMGTSALEGAARAVPTILLDLSYKEIPENYRFKWLYEASGYNLAEQVTEEHLISETNSFSKLLLEYAKDSSSVGESCSAYVKSYHSLDIVSHQLLRYLNLSQLTAKDIQNLTGTGDRSFTRRVYLLFRTLRERMKQKNG